jgi:hypothetical protein
MARKAKKSEAKKVTKCRLKQSKRVTANKAEKLAKKPVKAKSAKKTMNAFNRRAVFTIEGPLGMPVLIDVIK